MRTRPVWPVTSWTTRACRPTSAATPKRCWRPGSGRRWRRTRGRTRTRPATATTAKVANWAKEPNPRAAAPAAANPATASRPRAAVRVKISATPRTAATMIQTTASMALPAGYAPANPGATDRLAVRGAGDRQQHPEAGVAGRGGDPQVAAVALDHDAPADVEAEAGALADRLGGVEGLEDVGQDRLGDARAGVGDLDDQAVAVAAGADGQPALAVHALHGVDGVLDQVGPDLVELAGVGRQQRQRPVVVAHHLDARLQLVLEHGQGRLQPLVEVEPLQRAAVH